MSVHRFGDFTLDEVAAQLVGPDGPVAVEPQVFGVLVHLVTHAGELVTKGQLLDEVWGDRFVSESALTSRIRAARAAVGDDGRTQWAIATVHGRGYRFVADVTGGGTDGTGVAAGEPAPSGGDGHLAAPEAAARGVAGRCTAAVRWQGRRGGRRTGGDRGVRAGAGRGVDPR